MRKQICIFILTSLFVFSCTPVHAIEKEFHIDIASVTWEGAPGNNVSVHEVAEVFETKVIENWRKIRAINDSLDSDILNFSLGNVISKPIIIPQPIGCDDRNFHAVLLSIRNGIYGNLQRSELDSRSLIVVLPKTGCVWLAKADMGSPSAIGLGIMLQDNSYSFVIAHEIGHLFGLGHTNLMRCLDGSPDGPWSPNCVAVEYGGGVDLMSNLKDVGSLSIYHQWRLGLISSNQIYTSWKSEKIRLNSLDEKSGLKGIFLRDQGAAYWIEYRKAATGGLDESGLVIYRTDPPASQFIQSPLEIQPRINGSVAMTPDVWMLNLGNYVYSQSGNAIGNMKLLKSRQFITFSGNVRISFNADYSFDSVEVEIDRKPDINPPPTPIITDSSSWNSEADSVLAPGFEDRETTISEFEIEANGEVTRIVKTNNRNEGSTYLDPFNERKILRVGDLPEGHYQIRIRSKDIWGNLSPWSSIKRVLIDRSYPVIGSSISVTGIEGKKLHVALNDFKDYGSGLCKTSLFSDLGFIQQTNLSRSNPTLDLNIEDNLASNFETFDCLGNGLNGKINVVNQYKSSEDLRKSGRWIETKSGDLTAMRCLGRCSMSSTVKGNVAIVLGSGKADVLLNGKVILRTSDSDSTPPRVGANISVGSSSKIVRISGQNFVIYGLIQTRMQIINVERVIRSRTFVDSSLVETSQKLLARYGFREGDFSDSWNVIPMERGTTLLDPTLDLCSATYNSELGREYRRQVVATRAKSPYIFLSSEAVKYRDSEAASLALKELQSNFEACVRNKGGIESGGTFVDYVFGPLPSSDAPLVRAGSRVLVRAQIGKGVSARQLLAFYQFNGEMFTGLYIVKAGEISFSDNEVKSWFDVAGVLAQRLETKF